MHPSRAPIARLAVLSLVAAFYAFCVNGGVINGTRFVDFVAGYSPPYFAALWISEDARRTGYWPFYHYAAYVWGLWFLLVPHYILKTRGRAGLPLALSLYAILWAPAIAGLAGWWFYDELPDFR